ncbi:xanthine dehydrogenase accessory factor [Glaciihabitans tibetensis]|uniref:Xanthine dehydrogenase accessory factor n=1 Tax=Glaciihabitans tibetensis TaxID=1266600 RepID=A0A2T0VG16_9MICO|nr:XdhC/CoxI family protein [Glaciihabitans tibetensis]PRY69102.1 xanthine dehydrogenase accessory factor [Glaciihabitans tibetensis]
MFEIADRLLAALECGQTLAVATAVSIDGSAPRTVGTSMAYDGEAVLGSIAGGCVEGAVVGVCDEVLHDGMSRTVEYGVSDETAFEVGLTCGGQLRIHVQLVTPDSVVARQLAAAVRGDAAGIASVVGYARVVDTESGDPVSTSVVGSGNSRAANGVSVVVGGSDDRFASRIEAELASRMLNGVNTLSMIDCEGELLETFFEIAASPARMIIFGAMEYSAALSRAAVVLGYRVTVCDPRPLFATPTRFPDVEVVVAWPPHYLAETETDERTVICVLSHDDRFDADLVELALQRGVGYVGAMGSRRTSDRRFDELRERGVAEESLARLHSPIGLDLGASTPEETAVSILAEVIAARAAKPGVPLMSTRGSIHRVTA